MTHLPDTNVYNRQVKNKNVNSILERLGFIFKRNYLEIKILRKICIVRISDIFYNKTS